MIINHPGTWQQFQFRPDNRGLNIMEIKSKYLREQYLFEDQMNTLNQMHQQNAFMNGGGGGPAPSSEPTPEPTYTTSLQLVFNGTLENITSNYGFDVTSATAWNESGKFAFGEDPSNFETVEIVDDYTINLKGNEEGITIEEDAFGGDIYLTHIEDLNNNCVSEIVEGAFYQAGALERAVLDYVTIIGGGAFNDCSSLTSVRFSSLTVIPNGLDAEDGVFGSSDLSSDDLGEMFPALETIGDYAFNSTNIPSVTLDRITSISDYAFDNSRSIASLIINNTEASQKIVFGTRAFSNCSGLSNIEIYQDCNFNGGNDASIFANVSSEGGETGKFYSGNLGDTAVTYLENTLGWTITAT
jgi:hypothetical protein